MEATPQELMQVKGARPAQRPADLRHYGVWPLLCRERKKAGREYWTPLPTPLSNIKPLFLGLQNEVLYIILMDDSCHPLYDLKAAEGVPNHVSIDTRKLLRDVLRSNASTAILAHNHPTGPALPVPADQLTTLKIMQLLAPAGILFWTTSSWQGRTPARWQTAAVCRTSAPTPAF